MKEEELVKRKRRIYIALLESVYSFFDACYRLRERVFGKFGWHPILCIILDIMYYRNMEEIFIFLHKEQLSGKVCGAKSLVYEWR